MLKFVAFMATSDHGGFDTGRVSVMIGTDEIRYLVTSSADVE